MIREWTELLKLTGGSDFIIERVRIPSSGVRIEGEFTLPELARLTHEEQVFIMAFVGSHGSLKAMEDMFGISYPTVKGRLEKLASKLKMVEPVAVDYSNKEKEEDILNLLERGEITAREAANKLRGQ